MFQLLVTSVGCLFLVALVTASPAFAAVVVSTSPEPGPELLTGLGLLCTAVGTAVTRYKLGRGNKDKH